MTKQMRGLVVVLAVAFLALGIAEAAGGAWYGWPMIVVGILMGMAVHRGLRNGHGGRP
ncbi:hypothetical protein ACH9D2_18735 [Kocuria sp. M4R2S49]|uniref:hypothetical protein n=1 Tax=Kocuria rhizosphaericola TaxID=3376284 RepID=UPI0037B708A3